MSTSWGSKCGWRGLLSPLGGGLYVTNWTSCYSPHLWMHCGLLHSSLMLPASSTLKHFVGNFVVLTRGLYFLRSPPHFFQGWGWYVGAEGITCGLEWTVPCESPSCVKEDMPCVLGFLETSDHALASERPFVLELDEPLPLPSRTSHWCNRLRLSHFTWH